MSLLKSNFFIPTSLNQQTQFEVLIHTQNQNKIKPYTTKKQEQKTNPTNQTIPLKQQPFSPIKSVGFTSATLTLRVKYKRKGARESIYRHTMRLSRAAIAPQYHYCTPHPGTIQDCPYKMEN